MLPKIIQLDEMFENTGEPRCQILDLSDRSMRKFACADVMDYASTITPEPGFTNVLVLAMSASEYYGPNRNGDAFAEKPVKVNGQWAVAPGETLPEHFKTFERNAHVYRHHINKDPAKSFGTVRKAFYNWKMHRVELFLRISHATGADIVDKIDAGEYPAVSMGCRIKYDVCSHCGHKAPTTKHYCEHVNNMNPTFGMNRLLPSGERLFVWNPSPNLFDISFVFKPADKIGYMMKKVAYDRGTPYVLQTSAKLGAEAQDIAEKRSALLKMSDIDKIVTGDIVDPRQTPNLTDDEYVATMHTARIVGPWMRTGAPSVSFETLNEIGQCSLPEFASSMFAMDMTPTPVDIFRLICSQSGLGHHPDVEASLASSQGAMAELLSSAPHVLAALEDSGVVKLSSADVRMDVVRALRPYVEKRALAKDYLMRRYVPEPIGNLAEAVGITPEGSADAAYYTPTWQAMNVTDPKSGKRFQTTRGAAERADVENKKREAVEAAGIAGAAGLSYKALAAKHKALAAPAALGTILTGGVLANSTKTKTVKTDEGFDIPVNTDLIEKRSAAGNLLRVGLPIAGGALMTAQMAQDHAVAPTTLTQFASEHPVASWLGSTAALSAGAHGAGKLLGAAKRGVGSAKKTYADLAKDMTSDATKTALLRAAGQSKDDVNLSAVIDILGRALIP